MHSSVKNKLNNYHDDITCLQRKGNHIKSDRINQYNLITSKIYLNSKHAIYIRIPVWHLFFNHKNRFGIFTLRVFCLL